MTDSTTGGTAEPDPDKRYRAALRETLDDWRATGWADEAGPSLVDAIVAVPNPELLQLRAARSKFDERLSDLQAEMGKHAESWDRQRARLTGERDEARAELAALRASTVARTEDARAETAQWQVAEDETLAEMRAVHEANQLLKAEVTASVDAEMRPRQECNEAHAEIVRTRRLMRRAERLVDEYRRAKAQETRAVWATEEQRDEASAALRASAVTLPEDWREQLGIALLPSGSEATASAVDLIESWRAPKVGDAAREPKFGHGQSIQLRLEGEWWDGVVRSITRADDGQRRYVIETEGDDAACLEHELRPAGTGTEGARPLWREGDRVTWTDGAGVHAATVVRDEQPGIFVPVKYDGILLAGVVEGSELARIEES